MHSSTGSLLRGIVMPPKRVERTCEWCGETFWPRLAEVKRGWGRFCSLSCRSHIRKEDQASEYVYVDGVREHRLVAAQMLGRPLRSGEVVHHRNGDVRDNRPENLEVLESHAEHMRKYHQDSHKGGNTTLRKLRRLRRIRRELYEYRSGACQG